MTPASAKSYVCVKWDNGVCVSMHRVKGEQSSPYAVGYAFGPKYSYTAVSDVPQPVAQQAALSQCLDPIIELSPCPVRADVVDLLGFQAGNLERPAHHLQQPLAVLPRRRPVGGVPSDGPSQQASADAHPTATCRSEGFQNQKRRPFAEHRSVPRHV